MRYTPSQLRLVLQGHNTSGGAVTHSSLPDWSASVTMDITGWDDPAIARFLDRLAAALPAIIREKHRLKLRFEPLITLRGFFISGEEFETTWQLINQLLCERSSPEYPEVLQLAS